MENHNYNKDEKIPTSDNRPDVNPQPPLPDGNYPAESAPDLHASAETLNSDVKMWAMFCHLAALSTYVGIPFGNIIGPLIIWQIKKDEHPFIDEQGKAALNFQISITIYFIASTLLLFVVIGFFLLVGLAIFNLVMIIINGIKANNGQPTNYPLSFKFIS